MGNLLDCSKGTEASDPIRIPEVPKPEGTYLVEKKAFLPDSLIWKLQRKLFMNSEMLACMDHRSASFITSSSYLAHAYAQIILNYITDMYSRPDCNKTEPIYILELGAGHGRLGYLIIQHLVRMQDLWPDTDCLPFVYVFSDFSADILRWWKSHPMISEIISTGVMEMALIDLENFDGTFTLELSGTKVNTETLKNPPIVIMNAVGSALKQELFKVHDGELFKGLLSLYSSQKEHDHSDPDMVSRLKFIWDYEHITGREPISSNADAVWLMNHYRKDVERGVVLIPTTLLKTIRNVFTVCKKRVAFLIADTGYSKLTDISANIDPVVNRSISFSLPVNFHALSLFAESEKGFLLKTNYEEDMRVALMVCGMPHDSLIRTRWSYKNSIDTFTPECFFNLQKCVKEESSQLSLPTVLSLLRLSKFDSNVFYKYKQIVIDQGDVELTLSSFQKDIPKDLMQVRDEYFCVQKLKDICFELARMHMGLKMYTNAISLFIESNKYCSDHHVTWHNMGLCCFNLNDIENARKCLIKSIELDPRYVEARSFLAKIDALTEYTGNNSQSVNAKAEPEALSGNDTLLSGYTLQRDNTLKAQDLVSKPRVPE